MSVPMISSVRILALMERSLRVDVRRWPTYAVRFVVVGALLMTLISAHVSGGLMGAPGRTVFTSALYINFFIICAATGYFASAIAEEQEEQTLGLLKMTGLSPLSILLGKSTSRLIGALLLLLIQFPFILLAITLGGVSLRQIFAGYTTLLAFLFFVSNLSLFWSVICAQTRPASRYSGLCLTFFLIAPALGSLLLMILHYFNWAVTSGHADAVIMWVSARFTDASPFTRMGVIVTTGFNEPALGKQVWSNLALGIIFFGLAWWSFEAATRNDMPAAPGRSALLRRTGRLHALGARRAWSAPLAWKEFYFAAGGKVGLIIRVVLMGGLVALIAYFQSLSNGGGSINILELGITVMVTMTIIFVMELASLASRTFREEVKWKTLPALMVLPLTPRQIAYRKLAGGSLSLLPSIGFFGLGVLMAPSSFVTGFEGVFGSFWGWLVVVYVIFFLHLVAYLSLWIGWALAAGVLVCYIAPNCLGGMFMPFVVLGGGQFVPSMLLVPILLLLGGIIGLHYAIGYRMRKLAAE